MPKIFQCELIADVWMKDGEAEYSRWIELPFAPFVGLRINLQDGDDVFVVKEVEYSVDNDVFWLRESHGEDGWCDCKPDDKCCILDHSAWTEYGWKVKSERRGFDRFRLSKEMFNPEQNLFAKYDKEAAEQKAEATKTKD